MEQHPVFKKYTRDWLHERTGFSKIYLSRIAHGRVPLTRPFIERVCFALKEPEESLFLLNAAGISSGGSQNNK
jgi:hypothetical protein